MLASDDKKNYNCEENAWGIVVTSVTASVAISVKYLESWRWYR